LNKTLVEFLLLLLRLELLYRLFLTGLFCSVFYNVLAGFIVFVCCKRYGVYCCTNFVRTGVLGFVILHLVKEAGLDIDLISGERGYKSSYVSSITCLFIFNVFSA
jgi:hypothetical protein